MEEFVFDYIEKKLKRSKSVSFDTWSGDKIAKFYEEISNMYDRNNPIVDYNGTNYLITSHSGRDGMGGMDQGSPPSFDVMKVGDIKTIVSRPRPLDDIDFKPLIKMLESNMNDIVKGNYHDDDDDHYIWETAMKCVYGRDIFNWYNENVT